MWAECWPVQRQNVHGWAREWTDCVMQVRSRTAYWTRHAGPGPHKYTLATLAQIGIRPGSSARPPGKLEKLRCLSSHLIRQSFNSNGGCSYIKIICLETNLSNLYITSYMVSKIWSLYRMSTNHSFAALQSYRCKFLRSGHRAHFYTKHEKQSGIKIFPAEQALHCARVAIPTQTRSGGGIV